MSVIPSTHRGSLQVTDTLSAAVWAIPAGEITNAMIASSAGISASKLQSQIPATAKQTGSVVDATLPLHLVLGVTGTVVKVSVSNATACTGNATYTVDIKKNGTTILQAVITLDSSTGDYGAEPGVITVSGGVAGDVYTAVVATTIGTGALAIGLDVQMRIDEDYAS